MNRRRNKSGKKVLIITGCFIMAMAIAVAVCEGILLKKNRELRKGLQEQQKRYEKILYVAVSDIPAGNVLSEEHVKEMVRYTDEPQNIYMTREDFGKRLIVDVNQDTCLRKSMLLETGNELREVEIKKIEIPEYLKAGDRVDVRISYGNAEDYAVLIGKRLILCDDKTGIVVSIPEEEILLLSSALNDCERYQETRLYLVKYPDAQWVNEGKGNYIPNKEVLLLLNNSTEQKRREELEQRLEK